MRCACRSKRFKDDGTPEQHWRTMVKEFVDLLQTVNSKSLLYRRACASNVVEALEVICACSASRQQVNRSDPALGFSLSARARTPKTRNAAFEANGCGRRGFLSHRCLLVVVAAAGRQPARSHRRRGVKILPAWSTCKHAASSPRRRNSKPQYFRGPFLE